MVKIGVWSSDSIIRTIKDSIRALRYIKKKHKRVIRYRGRAYKGKDSAHYFLQEMELQSQKVKLLSEVGQNVQVIETHIIDKITNDRKHIIALVKAGKISPHDAKHVNAKIDHIFAHLKKDKFYEERRTRDVVSHIKKRSGVGKIIDKIKPTNIIPFKRDKRKIA